MENGKINLFTFFHYTRIFFFFAFEIVLYQIVDKFYYLAEQSQKIN